MSEAINIPKTKDKQKYKNIFEAVIFLYYHFDRLSVNKKPPTCSERQSKDWRFFILLGKFQKMERWLSEFPINILRDKVLFSQIFYLLISPAENFEDNIFLAHRSPPWADEGGLSQKLT